MKLVNTLHSSLDQSVNFIFEGDFPGFFEARYVRRCPEYFVCYLSSQSGCKQGCRQCHLTATKQTQVHDACPGTYLKQAKAVFEHYNKQPGPKAKKVHFSFMARGEPLENEWLLGESLFSDSRGNMVVDQLADIAFKNKVYPRFCVSTIMPKSLKENLANPSEKVDLAWFFKSQPVDIYYSIYSTDEEWKKKWMPQALPVDEALDILVDYQDKTRKIIKIHWPMIKDENDSITNTMAICDKIVEKGLRVDINIVRYNPFSPEFGEESSEVIVENNARIIQSCLPDSKVKVIPRVGHDVYGSCGTFYV
jgi:23S rRNA (adenine2503-C2)-methyltransferase